MRREQTENGWWFHSHVVQTWKEVHYFIHWSRLKRFPHWIQEITTRHIGLLTEVDLLCISSLLSPRADISRRRKSKPKRYSKSKEEPILLSPKEARSSIEFRAHLGRQENKIYRIRNQCLSEKNTAQIINDKN